MSAIRPDLTFVQMSLSNKKKTADRHRLPRPCCQLNVSFCLGYHKTKGYQISNGIFVMVIFLVCGQLLGAVHKLGRPPKGGGR